MFRRFRGIGMILRELKLFVACAASALWAAGAFAASDKPKPAPEPTPKQEAEPIPGDPQLTTASYGDWVERCQRVTANGEPRRVCEVALTVVASGQTQPLAEVAVGRPRKGAPLKLTLVLPVNVGLPSAPKITADNGDAFELAWRQCVPAGCFADAAFSADAQRVFREAKSAKVESKAAGGGLFNFQLSLRGLPQALDALAREP
jgi:invasion protein IalB